MMSLIDQKKDERLNKTDSKELFRKCKQIIKQQKQQIEKLMEQNSTLMKKNESQIIISLKKDQLNKQINSQLAEVKQKNQLLHKELAKNKLMIQNLTQKISNLQSNLKLQANNIQHFQNQLQKNNFLNQQLQTKNELIEQTLTLLDNQNQKLRKMLMKKQSQIMTQISQVKQLNNILKRKHQMEILQGQFAYVQKVNDPYVRPFHISNQQLFNRSATKSAIQNPQKCRNNASTDYKRSKSNPKNMRSKLYEVQSQQLKKMKGSPILQLSGKTFNFGLNQNHKDKKTHLSLQNQLKNIKQSILQQYQKMQNKKQTQNKFLINNTLKQIENKLGRMIKVTQDNEDSDDQF